MQAEAAADVTHLDAVEDLVAIHPNGQRGAFLLEDVVQGLAGVAHHFVGHAAGEILAVALAIDMTGGIVGHHANVSAGITDGETILGLIHHISIQSHVCLNDVVRREVCTGQVQRIRTRKQLQAEGVGLQGVVGIIPVGTYTLGAGDVIGIVFGAFGHGGHLSRSHGYTKDGNHCAQQSYARKQGQNFLCCFHSSFSSFFYFGYLPGICRETRIGFPTAFHKWI